MHAHVHTHSSICVTWEELFEVTQMNFLLMTAQILSLYLLWQYCYKKISTIAARKRGGYDVGALVNRVGK